MKKICAILFLCFFALPAISQNPLIKIDIADTAKKIQVVEASCGECRFGMKGKGCDLAIRINGKSYFVDGTSINDHGDAHAKDGFCEAIRKAKVQGEIVDNRFRATYFQLVSPADKKE